MRLVEPLKHGLLQHKITSAAHAALPCAARPARRTACARRAAQPCDVHLQLGGHAAAAAGPHAGAALPSILALDVDVAPAPQHPSRSQQTLLRTPPRLRPRQERTCTENGAVASVPERSMLRSAGERMRLGRHEWAAAVLGFDQTLQQRDCSGGWSAGVCLQQHPIIPHCVLLYGLALSCCKTLQLAVAVGCYGCTVNETAVCTKQNNALSNKQCWWACRAARPRACRFPQALNTPLGPPATCNL